MSEKEMAELEYLPERPAPAVDYHTKQALTPARSYVRTMGNQAAQRVAQRNAVGTRPHLGDPNDAQESEADRAAASIMANQASNLPQQPASDRVHGKDAARKVLGARSGRPMDLKTKRWVASAFRTNFDRVRVHTDDDAARSVRSVDARAYTIGDNIVFGSGQYTPYTPRGRKLLAHELTHVVQARTDPTPVLRRDNGSSRASEPPTVTLSPLVERHSALLAALPAATRAQLEQIFSPEREASGEAASAQTAGSETAPSVSVRLEHILDPDAAYADLDVWPLVYEQLTNGNGRIAGMIMRNEINRRYLQRRSLDAITECEIRVDDVSRARLTFVVGEVEISAADGLLTLSGIDSAYPRPIIEDVAAEVSDEARQVGDAAALVQIADTFGANVSSYVARVRRNFAQHSLHSIRMQLADARRLKLNAERLSQSSLTRQFTRGLPTQFDTPIESLQTVYQEAQRWHRTHQPDITNQEIYTETGTDIVTYAGEEWESGGGGYVTGGLAYGGAAVWAIFDGLGNLFTFGYQGNRGQIVGAYRQGRISYSTMEDLSEDAAIRSLTTGVVTVAITVATMGLGGAVAGGLGLARGTLAYGFVAGGTEAAIGNLAMMGTETLLTEARPAFSDPYAQAIWQQGSHSFGSIALGTGLGFATGGVFGMRGYPGNVRTPTSLALPEETFLSGSGFGTRGQPPPIWEITSLGVEQTTGMQRYAGRHITGEVFELVVDSELTSGYIIRHSTGEIISFGQGGFQRSAGLLTEGLTASAGPATAAEPAVAVLGGRTRALSQSQAGVPLAISSGSPASLSLGGSQAQMLALRGSVGAIPEESATLSVTGARRPLILGPAGEVVVGSQPVSRSSIILDVQGRPLGGNVPQGGPTSPVLYGAGGEPISGIVRVNIRSGVYHTPDSPWYNSLGDYVEMPEEWAAGLFRRAYQPRTRITPTVIEGRVAESAGAAPGGPGIITGRAQTPQSIVTAIIADKGESMGYQAALARGEYGLQRPLGANVPGSDFITASVERVTTPEGGLTLQATIFLNDAKISGVPRFPTPAGIAKPSWLAEVQAAVAPDRLSLPDGAVEEAIRRAAAEGRVRLRQVEIDYSSGYAGTVEGRVRFRSSVPATPPPGAGHSP